MSKTSSPFGSYLSMLRTNQHLTQEQLAKSIGKKKMTICQWEQGTNDPPQEALLINLSKALNTTPVEQKKLFDLACAERGTLPPDVIDYYNSSKVIPELLHTAAASQYTDDEWAAAAKYIRKLHNQKNRSL
jgi:transcriptional regulator with XRE-family HTH domain